MHQLPRPTLPETLFKAKMIVEGLCPYHDLRRTAATRMAEGKVSRFIIERALGHADQGVTATYDRASYRDEKLEAFEVVASVLSGTKSDNGKSGAAIR
jgi:integrase